MKQACIDNEKIYPFELMRVLIMSLIVTLIFRGVIRFSSKGIYLTLLLFFLGVFSNLSSYASNKYWVNGSGKWNDISHWSDTSGGKGNASIPTVNDNVIFENKSFNNEAKSVVTINGMAFCRDFNWYVNGLSPIIKGNDKVTLTIAGNLILTKWVNIDYSGEIIFQSNQSNAILCKPELLSDIRFKGNGNWNIGHLFTKGNILEGKDKIHFKKGSLKTQEVSIDAESNIYGKAGKGLYSPQNVNLNIDSIHTTNDSTPAATNGTILAFVSNGTPPVSYQLEIAGVPYGPPQINNPLFTGLGANTYELQVSDLSGGWSVWPNIKILAPDITIINVITTEPSCSGSSNATIRVEVSADNFSPFTYQYSTNGTTWTSFTTAAYSHTFSGLAAGSYYVRVKDNSGYTVKWTTYPLSISSPSAVTFTTSSTNPSCNGGNNGNITVTAHGGTGSYSYSKDDVTWQGSNIITPLTAGSYNIYVKDSLGCTPTPASQSVTLTQPAAVSFTTTSTNPTCNGYNNGNITVTAHGGTGSYNYSKDDVTWQVSNIITPLTAGSYTIYVKDSLGCIPTPASQNVTLTQPASVTFTTAPTNPTCNGGNNGFITVTAHGGTPPYKYSKDNITWQVSNIISLLTAGSYNIYVKDSLGCTPTPASQNVTLSQPAVVTFTTAATNPTCHGGNNGFITVTAHGGTPPYKYSKDNITWQVSNIISTLTAGSYNIYVKDSLGCTPIPASQNVTLTQPAAVTFTTAATNPSCNGSNNGFITVTAHGGTGSYKYSKDDVTWQVSNIITPLTAGSYTIYVKDSLGCTPTPASQNVTLTQPAAVTFTTAPTNPTCNGGNNGFITITAHGGTGSYKYSKDDATWQVSNIISPLTVGSYTIYVKDSLGCIPTPASQNVTLTQPAAVTFTTSVINDSCSGSNNGSITVTALGGTPPYKYSKDDIHWQANKTFSNLIAGIYTIYVKDSLGCTPTPIFENVTVSQPLTLVISPTPTNPNCFGLSNGQIVFTVNGGTSPYTNLYSSNMGVTWNPATSPITGLGAGSYEIKSTDSKLCSTTTTVVLTNPAAMIATVTKTDVTTCFGNKTGQIKVTSPTGGSGTYQFSDGGVWSGTLDSIIWNGLAAGSYEVEMRDAANQSCVSVLNNNLVINQPTQVTFTCKVQNILCFGQANGTITVIATGGTPGIPTHYWYSKNGGITWPQGYPDSVFTGLSQGTYPILVKDANGCKQALPTNEIITQPNKLLISSETKDESLIKCYGESLGKIFIQTSGGTPKIRYSIDGGVHFSAPTSAIDSFTNLPAGSYLTVVKDSNNCADTGNTNVISEPPLIKDSVTVGNVTPCYGDSTGYLLDSATGGTGLLKYTLTGLAPYNWTGLFTSLTGGNYTVTVIDQNGCSKTDNATITQPPAIKITSYTPTEPSCNGTSDGKIDIGATGGTGLLEYALDAGALQISGNFTNVPAGSHTIKIVDQSSCEKDTTFTLSQPGVITITSATDTNILCNGQTNGKITVIATGGTNPLSYTLTPGPINNHSGLFTNLAANTYSVSVEDIHMCPPASEGNLVINEPTVLKIDSVVNSDSICFASNAGFIKVYASGAVPPYQYSTDNGIIWVATYDITSLVANTYKVQVRDSNLCLKNWGNVKISNYPAISISSLKITNVSTCFADSTGQIIINAAGGRPPFNYSINSGTSYQPNDTFNTLKAKTYSIVVKDFKTCTKDTSATVTEPTKITVTIATTNVNPPTLGSIDVGVTGGSGSKKVEIVELGLIYNTTKDPDTAKFSNINVGTYTVQVTDANGCTTKQMVTIINSSIFNVTVHKTDITCNGDNNGTITIIAGGLPPYNYTVASLLWGNQNPSGPGFYNNLRPGQYFITVKDSLDHTIKDTVVINNPLPISITLTKQDAIGASNGEITITASGGTGSLEYSDSNGVSYIDSNVFANLDSGFYRLAVKDSLGCIGRDSIRINYISGLLTVLVDDSTVTCPGEKDGHIFLMVLDTNYTLFSIDSGVHFSSSGNFPNLPVGVYYVIVKDDLNKQFTQTITFSSPSLINLNNSTISMATCNNAQISGSPNGAITDLSVSGGTPGYTYAWFSAGDTVSKADSLVNVKAGSYSLVVKDSKNCALDTSLTIHSLDTVIANAGDTAHVCYNISLNLVGQGGTSESWKALDKGDSVLVDSTIIAGTKIYNYSTNPITDSVGHFELIASSGICYDLDTLIVLLKPRYRFSIESQDTLITAGREVTLNVTGSYDSYYAKYQLYPCVDAKNVTDTSCTYTNPAIVVSPQNSTMYTIIATTKSQYVLVPNNQRF